MVLRNWRTGLFAAAAAASLLTGCWPKDSEQGPVSLPTAPPAPASTTSAVPAPSATPLAPFGGWISLGFDHPPFEQVNSGVGGNSVGMACGGITGAPEGATVMLNLTGGTGAPASVKGALGKDGAFVLRFPLTSYGDLTATLGTVTVPAGAPLQGSVPPVTLKVAAGVDVACARR